MKNNNKRTYRNEFRMVFLLSEKIALTICSTTTNGASIRGVILGTKHTNEASTCWKTKTPKCTIWKEMAHTNPEKTRIINWPSQKTLTARFHYTWSTSFSAHANERENRLLGGNATGGIGLFVRARMLS